MRALILFVVVIVATACGGKKEADGGGSGGGGGAGDKRTACVEPAPADDCYEYPASVKDRSEIHAKICKNYEGATFLDGPCPRKDTVGGCKTKNEFDTGAPTVFHYHMDKAAIEAKCAEAGDVFVAP